MGSDTIGRMAADTLVTLLQATFDRLLFERHGPFALSVVLEEAAIEEGGLYLPIRVITYDAEGSIQDIKEQRVLLIERDDLEAPEARVAAYIEGWVKAVPELLSRAHAANGEWVMPEDCVCPIALRDRGAQTADDFTALILREDGPMKEMRARLAEDLPFSLDDATYRAFLAREQLEGEGDTEARRVRALEDALAAFPAVSARVKEDFGLDLPRTVMVFDAFWRSLSRAEEEAHGDLDLPRPVGLLEYFADGGLARRTVNGLDPRLHWRFRSDPPELVTALLGGSDGEHYGLFYDDPNELPAGVAQNYARDSAETWWYAPTLLGVLEKKLDRIAEESLGPDYFTDVPRAACQVRLLQEALGWFSEIEEEAQEADRSRLVMDYEARRDLPQIVCGVGAYVPGVRRAARHVTEISPGYGPFSDIERVRGLVEGARAALDRGDALEALALGRDLHWADQDELREETLELLVRAYRALGRGALASLVEVHHRHRDLPYVTVF